MIHSDGKYEIMKQTPKMETPKNNTDKNNAIKILMILIES